MSYNLRRTGETESNSRGDLQSNIYKLLLRGLRIRWIFLIKLFERFTFFCLVEVPLKATKYRPGTSLHHVNYDHLLPPQGDGQPNKEAPCGP